MPKDLAAAEKYMDLIVEFAIAYGFQVIYAIIILIVGLIVARWLSNMVVRVCGARRLDVTLSRFLGKNLITRVGPVK